MAFDFPILTNCRKLFGVSSDPHSVFDGTKLTSIKSYTAFGRHPSPIIRQLGTITPTQPEITISTHSIPSNPSLPKYDTHLQIHKSAQISAPKSYHSVHFIYIHSFIPCKIK
ncbi:hypothetical protein OCU04_006649 [Sclerotinia nivalis]|uniref:Uncharacterized protein n=1 Tax=Sclerotinia nivalis TaxID=352851 RepID=A0A9X0ANM9_9HELO|nr:hypothetical protein OCU04_006649 [Sclerotinia nivalis]